MSKDKKTILITGGAGFVGSHLCKRYLGEGHKVICIDNLQKSRTTDNIDPFEKNKNFKFIKHDINNPIEFKEKIDWVMNFACPVSCVDLQVDPIHTAKSNVHGVINMLEIARKHDAVFIQASSSDVYGVREKGEVMREDMLGQVDTLTARACYEEEKGMMRFDINISIRKKGEKKFGTKVEVKNLNSFKFLEQALDYEFERQVKALEAGEKIVQETRGWNTETGTTESQRSKEEAHDYRYFPEPDLPPMTIF